MEMLALRRGSVAQFELPLTLPRPRMEGMRLADALVSFTL